MRSYLQGSAAVALALVCSAAYAQETTSSIRGVVTAADAAVSGAVVTVKHLPSGTTATATTGGDGSFALSGLRVGGPFTVSVSATGFGDTTISDIQLTAGQPLRLPIALETGEEILVTASKSGATELSSGPITSISREGIEGVASIARDIRDVARRSPFASLDPTNGRSLEIAGQNGRLNKFSVDGVRFSDNFGLNNGGLPTARGPVPLDAIEQLSVKIAPYDVSEGDFQGGAINVVLRSGNNDFSGSAFYTYTDDSLTGDRTRDRSVSLNFDSKNYGGFLSGPIIKDKLFFAISYEKLDESQPIDVGLAGSANPVPGLSQATVDQVTGISNSVYGYDPLGVFSNSVESDEKYTVKLDWNVVDGQRASFTYIHNEGGVGSPNSNDTRAASPAIGLRSIAFYRPEEVDAGTFQLNSDWSDDFSTETRLVYRESSILPAPFGAPGFGQFQVCTDPNNPVSGVGAALISCSQGSSASPGAARIFFGTGQFQQANLLKTKNYGGDITARLSMGDHTFKFIAGYNFFDVTNLFVRDALGTYYFDSVSDFQNRRANTLALQGSITGDLQDVAANYGYSSYLFALQDSWDVTSRFNLTYGGRIDLYGSQSTPPLNRFFLQRYGFRNNATIKGKYIFQPRLGLTWQATDALTLRGGVGLFAGGSPDVLLSNSFTQAGVLGNAIGFQRTATGCIDTSTRAALSPALCSAALDNVDGKTINPLVQDYLRTNTAALASTSTNSQDPDYKLQSTWKWSLSADYAADLGPLGDGWNLGADVYYGQTNNAPSYTDLRAVRIGTMPDGRPRYSTAVGANSDLFLYNTKAGHSLVAVARFDKRFDFDLNIGASYTFQDIEDVNPLNSGTTASGIYGNTAMVDPNFAAAGTSDYQIRHSFKFNIDYDHAFFGDYKTRVSLFGELRSGRPYSLTMNDPVLTNGRSSVFGVVGTSNRHLLYVPNVASETADPLVTYDSTATFTALQNFIQSNGLSKYQGRIIPKNTQRSPNYFKVDLHVDQEIPVPAWRQARVKLFADLENVLNFIDKDWGSLRQTNLSAQQLATVVNVACAKQAGSNCTQYRYSSFTNPALINQARFSLWGVRLGAKFEF
ncbi:TonB-dependent receptor [Sphingomonas oleivorans]|nr:carboxypeptidase regulatory-like domain-containing protein [Sphingomonas oleivorans]